MVWFGLCDGCFCWLVVVLFGFGVGGFCKPLGWVYAFCCWLVFCVLMVRLFGFVCVWLYVVVLFGVCILLVGFDGGVFRVFELVVVCWLGLFLVLLCVITRLLVVGCLCYGLLCCLFDLLLVDYFDWLFGFVLWVCTWCGVVISFVVLFDYYGVVGLVLLLVDDLGWGCLLVVGFAVLGFGGCY